MFTPIVARPEFDQSENTTVSTEDTKVNIEVEDEEPPSKMYSKEKEMGKEMPKEFQKKNDKWIYSTERKKEIIFAT